MQKRDNGAMLTGFVMVALLCLLAFWPRQLGTDVVQGTVCGTATIARQFASHQIVVVDGMPMVAAPPVTWSAGQAYQVTFDSNAQERRMVLAFAVPTCGGE